MSIYAPEVISELARIALTINDTPFVVPDWKIAVDPLQTAGGMGINDVSIYWSIDPYDYARRLKLPRDMRAGLSFTGGRIVADESQRAILLAWVSGPTHADMTAVQSALAAIRAASVPPTDIQSAYVNFSIGGDLLLTMRFAVGKRYRYRDYSVRQRDGRSIIQKLLPGLLAIGGLAGIFGPLISSIGNAIVPANVAAAYPGLVNAVGGAALQTAINGGDLQSALTSQLAGIAGAQVGAGAKLLVDSDALARVAAAATRAALLGQSIGPAVAGTLVNMGAQQSAIVKIQPNALDSTQPGIEAPKMQLNEGISVPGNIWSGGFVPSIGLQPTIDPPGLDFDSGALTNAGWDWGADLGTGSLLPPSLQPTQDVSFDWRETVRDIGQAAMIALQVVRAYKGQPLIATGQQTSQGTVRANPDGTVTYTNATGSRTGIPPAGQPFAIGDGRMIVNNGDGSFTLIGADGSRAVIRYPSGVGAAPGAGLSAGNYTTPLLIGGAALLAFALLRRK